MNRLWVRLSLAFSGVILVVVAVIGFLPPFVIHNVFPPEYLRNPRTSKAYTRLSDELSVFYQARQGWTGVELLLEGAQAVLPPDQSGILLADDQGTVVYDAQDNGMVGHHLDRTGRTRDLPVQVDGMIVGYLGMRPVEDRVSPLVSAPAETPAERAAARTLQDRANLIDERFLLEQLLRFLWLATIIGAPCAIVLGILMSRSLTAPLNRLAEAARGVGSRDFSRRVGVVGSTEMIEVAQAFNEMVDALGRSEILRRSMIADVAHELRTPLTILQGNLRAILDDVYPLSKQEIAGLYDQTRHLSRLVKDLHELAQAEAGQLPLDLQPVDIPGLARATASSFTAAAESEGVTLSDEMPPDLPPVRADRARLTQVLYNLLANALRHSSQGGTISLRAGEDLDSSGLPASAWLEVRDAGDGIPAQHLPHVFERFYRTDLARSRDAGGAGLGLAIVRAIVEAHGGHVSASSEGVPGCGSTFTVHIPFWPVNGNPVQQ